MIYCVEDDTEIREIELYTLRACGYEAEGFADGETFFAAVKTNLPNLILLDVMLPGGCDGVDILKKLKADSRTAAVPVIMATAKGAEYDKIESLDIGADDYLVKPFGMMEMTARVKTVLRRAEGTAADKILKCGGVVLDDEKHTVKAAGAETELTFREFALLRLLISHPGAVFTRDRLLNEIWGFSYDGETRTVDVHIRSLRAKLGACGSIIGTVRGVGYRAEEDKK